MPMISLEKTSKLLIYIPLALLVFALLISSYFYFFDPREEASGKAPVEITAFNSDKKIYGSGEDVIFKAVLKVSRPEEAAIYIRGVKPYKRFYIDLKENISLKKGKNSLEFTGTTPSCTSGCGGVNPGSYDIALEIRDKAGALLASDAIKIELISR